MALFLFICLIYTVAVGYIGVMAEWRRHWDGHCIRNLSETVTELEAEIEDLKHEISKNKTE